jgi:hypothetical protein
MQRTFSKPFQLIILFSVLSFGSVSAQGNIQSQFEEFYSTETSNWQEYKLIKKPRLKEFWSLVTDTLKIKEIKIVAAKAEVVVLNEELAEVNQKLQGVESELQNSKELNDSISFLGFQMKKSAYSSMVWIIIFGLIALSITLYLLYIRNNKVTKEARANLFNSEQEYTAHKEQSRENQSKLKRELQTALNALQENRIKF